MNHTRSLDKYIGTIVVQGAAITICEAIFYVVTGHRLKDQSISDIVTERQQQLGAFAHDVQGMATVMGGIKDLYEQLVEKEDEIVQSMNLHKRLLLGLTIWRLPAEVLSHIFIHCLPKTKHLSPASNLAPMLLTRVCRRWREVAVGMSSLWRRLSVKVIPEHWQRNAFCYDTWLKRSRGRPISLELQWQGNVSTELQSLLQPYLKQVSSIYIVSFETTEKPALVLKDLPALRQLNVVMYGPFAPALDQFIQCMPFTLRSLQLLGMWFDLTGLSAFNPLLSHLTNIEINICNPIACLRLLQLAPNLSSLTIGISIYATEALQPLTHTKLQSLCITFAVVVTNRLPDLFNALSLPRLRVLEAREVAQWPHEALKALLERSNCPLERLIFGDGVTTDEQQAEYVALIPSLEYMCVK
ncbi:hypothetical protein DEU56DRAFT_757190 [Suillus clintonianus]|uniref:uncharacterized protein n=1 Tax=Suillus clintonianus TaxID=1904413 RepID=UPI001B86FE2E|nr:uncharacterized protein DEU56DRAFT_757190 [Suillus clintonianus]KAG2132957.1 hypothetical protein DEU56DRAFT_757190 [Suillus clintonianus]